MSRNKYPEETYNLIVSVATKLFIEKGYEKTSLNDIINNLGGLTKGAIYHHFKSKEHILVAVVNKLCGGNEYLMLNIQNDKTLNGKEKLEKMFSVSLDNHKQEDLFAFIPNLLNNPTFLSYYIKILTVDVIPSVAKVIDEGVKDGSIHTKYPDQLAHLLMFITDLWLNPLVFKMDNEEIIKRARLTNDILKPFGINIFTKQSISRLLIYNNLTK